VEMNLEARSSELRDPLGGHIQASLEMHSEGLDCANLEVVM